MPEKKPIVLTEGQMEQIQQGDYLPNQPEIDENKRLICKLVRELVEHGWPINDPELLNLLNYEYGR